jgi:hypothetical protein
MSSVKIRQLVRRIYDRVETALWALMIASIVLFIVFILPKVPDIRANIVSMRAEEIAAENADFCERLGMRAGTREHGRCLIDAGAFRLKVEQRLDEEYSF